MDESPHISCVNLHNPASASFYIVGEKDETFKPFGVFDVEGLKIMLTQSDNTSILRFLNKLRKAVDQAFDYHLKEAQ